MKNKPYKYQIAFFITGTVLIFLYSQYNSGLVAENNRKFYENKFSTTILLKEVRNGRVMRYTLSNGLTVAFLLNAHENINVGDSITKDANTYSFDVYRKNADSLYYFIAKYRLNEGL